MSYILEALKRADAERSRGAVPGLHASALPAMAEPTSQRRGWRVAIAAGAVVLAGVLMTLWWRAPAAVPPGAALPVVASAPPSMTVGIQATPPIRAVSNPSTESTGATAATPLPVTATISQPVTPTASLPATEASIVAKPAPMTSKPVAPPADVQPLPFMAALPEDLRRQIPALAITGVVYSSSPGQRLLLVNGQVLPQGSTVGAELVLEEIGERSSVFRFRGTRFRLNH
jgi:general secretion pathway protein B